MTTHITKEGLLQAVKELGTGPALYEPGVMDWILTRAAELSSAQESKPVGLKGWTFTRIQDGSIAVSSPSGSHVYVSSDSDKNGKLGSFVLHELASAMLAANVASSVSAPDASPKDGWQPIETAPKDGRWILQSHIESGGIPWIGRYAKGTFSWWDERGTIRDPTHWQPLPEPPHD